MRLTNTSAGGIGLIAALMASAAFWPRAFGQAPPPAPRYLLVDVAGNLSPRVTTPELTWPLDVPVAIQPRSLTLGANGRLLFSSLTNHLVGELDLVPQAPTAIIAHRLWNGDVEILDPGPVLEAPCPDSGGTCQYIAEWTTCTVWVRDASSGVIDRFAGGTCGDPVVDVPRREMALWNVSALGYAPSTGLLIGTCAPPYEAAIYRIHPATGLVELFAGTLAGAGFSGDGTPAAGAAVSCPWGLVAPASAPGNPTAIDGVVFADLMNDRVRRVAGDGIITTIAGGGSVNVGDGGPAVGAWVQGPRAVTRSANGDYYIGQHGRVRRVNGVTGVISTVAGNGVASIGQPGMPALQVGLQMPIGLVLAPNGDLFIAEHDGARVSVVRAATGLYDVVLGSTALTHTELFFNGDGRRASDASLAPTGDVWAGPNGEVIFSEPRSHRVRRYDPETDRVVTLAGAGRPPPSPSAIGDGGPATDAFLRTPVGVARTPDGRTAILEYAGCRIRQIDGAGVISTLVGTGECTTVDGPAASARLGLPLQVTVDPSGHLYWVEHHSNSVRKLDALTGQVTTLAGTGPAGFSGDGGPAASAMLATPSDVIYDAASGRLFVADTANFRIRVIDLNQQPPTIDTLAGTGVPGFAGDGGPARMARLGSPEGVDVSGGGLVIADWSNYRIRRVAPLSGGVPLITTIAGTGQPGHFNRGGLATLARLREPGDVSAAADGSVVISETGGRRVARLVPDRSGIPSAPEAPAALVEAHRVTLTWLAPISGAPPSRYIVNARLAAGGPLVATLPVGAATALAVSASDGTFVVTVQAENAAGVGPESSPLTVSVPAVPPPPGPPSNLAAVVVGSTVAFSWRPPTAGGSASLYTLVAALSPGGPPLVTLPIAPLTDAADRPAATVTTFTVAAVPAGIYYVRLTAQNLGGTSASSNEVTVTVAPPNAPVLNAPAVSGSTVTLTWTPSAGPVAQSFLLTAALSANGAPIASMATMTPAVTVGGVVAGTYYVRVRAVNAVGQSGPSNEVVVVVN